MLHEIAFGKFLQKRYNKQFVLSNIFNLIKPIFKLGINLEVFLNTLKLKINFPHISYLKYLK